MVCNGARVYVTARIRARGVTRNTRSVCRKSYIHPAVLDAYESGLLASSCANRSLRSSSGLRPDEAMTIALLRKCERSSGVAKAA